MAVETRGNHQYLYLKRREGGRVVSIYAGKCSAEEFAFQAEDRRRELAERRQLRDEDRRIVKLLRDTRLFVNAALIAEGYHQHHGQWRKSRVPKQTPKETPEPSPDQSLTRQQVTDLVIRTNKENPRPEDVAELRRALENDPKLWTVAGNLLTGVINTQLCNVQGTAFVKESLSNGVDRVRAELGAQTAPAIERLLIDQVALCWLRLGVIETLYQRMVMDQGFSFESGIFWERRLTLAHKRFNTACESLARVRRLSRGDSRLQLNIAAPGGQQVNVMAGKLKAKTAWQGRGKQ